MLTKDLLIHRRVKDRIHPQLVDPEDPPLLELSARLCEVLAGAVGETRDAVAANLAEVASGFGKPKVAKGLVKLVMDALELDEPGEAVSTDRLQALRSAALVLRALPDDATPAAYETALAQALPLEAVRSELYRDLPGARPVVEVRPLTAPALLHRYNLAQVQGLVLHAEQVRVEVPMTQRLELRRVLRWLRFCRLVSRVEPKDSGFELVVEGPGKILDGAKRYGLQLAEFVAVVPVLSRFRLSAEVRMRGRGVSLLRLDESAGLVSPHDRALGYVPEPLLRVVESLGEHPDWRVDPDPPPRHVGAKEMCVPDLALEHRRTGVRYDVELFHRWHARAFARRLEQLATRPEAGLILGVERALKLEEAGLSSAKVFRFREFVRFEQLQPLLEGEA